MANETIIDAKTGRKSYLDYPDDLAKDEPVTFILSLHGGGSVGAWQREYFPAHDYAEPYRLVIATPSAATKEPARRWVGEADDDHLRNVVELVVDRFGAANVRAFWLAGHSQGGMTSQRLLNTPYFADRVDGWLSLSGGRLGRAPRAENFGPPPVPGQQPRTRMAGLEPPPLPVADFSFIFTTGEHEIASLPETSPWAEKYGAGPRVQQPEVVDTEPGRIHDSRREGNSSKSWGFKPKPGAAHVYVYPDAKEGRVIADAVRLDKGHTEGLEPKITEELVKLIVSAPGGKIAALATT